jgi:hypothetical protein
MKPASSRGKTVNQESLQQRAATRCANELGKAILYSRALEGLSKADGYYGIDFIRLAEWAFFDQMFAHSMKALDPREKAGFWFLHKSYSQVVPAVDAQDADLSAIKKIIPKLQLIRDKTHFHLDRSGVENPTRIWADADITKGELDEALAVAFGQVRKLHKYFRGCDFDLPRYDGTDATRVAEIAYKQRLLEGQLP